MAQAKRKIAPLAGNQYLALVVGGTPSFQVDVQKNLAMRGIYVRDMWNAGSGPLIRRPIPDDLDLVLIIRDNRIPSKERDKLRFVARTETRWCFQVNASMKEINETLDVEGFMYKEPLGPAETAPELSPTEMASGERGVYAEQYAAAPPTVALVKDHPQENPAFFGDRPPYTPDEALEALQRFKTPAEQKEVALKAGAYVRKIREKAGVKASAVAKALGLSTAAIHLLESKGLGSWQVCEAVEIFLGIPPVLPRISRTKVTRKLKMPTGRLNAKIVPPAPAPVTATAPHGPPIAPPIPWKSQVVVDRRQFGEVEIHQARRDMMIAILGIQARMKEVGVSSIVIQPWYLNVTDESAPKFPGPGGQHGEQK